jgi:hypothetical protein
MLNFLGCAHSPEVAPEPKTREALPAVMQVAGNCTPIALDKSLSVSFCKEQYDEKSGWFQVRLFEAQKPMHELTGSWNPMMPDPFDHVRIEGFNERWVAVSYNGTECSPVQVIDRKKMQLALNTGCWQAGYYSVRQLPKAGECQIVLSSGEGDNNQVIRPPYQYDLCGGFLDFSKSVPGEKNNDL